MMDKIKIIESNVTELQGDIIVNQQKQKENEHITDDEVSKLKQEVQTKVTQYKVLLNDKSALFEEMYEVALIMINRDKQIIKNEEEIVQLRHEIDINILEIEQKTAIISELQETLLAVKAEYKKLKKEIRELEEQCDELTAILKQKDEDLMVLEEMVREKDVLIHTLEKTLGEKHPEIGPSKKEVESRYKAVKGDEVDELIAKYIN